MEQYHLYSFPFLSFFLEEEEDVLACFAAGLDLLHHFSAFLSLRCNVSFSFWL